MEELNWLNKTLEIASENPWLTSTLVPAVIGFLTTGYLSYKRRPTKVSQGGRYFENADLLKPPMTRPAYSDRMAYVLAEMSALSYFEFEGSAGALEQAAERFIKINSDVNNDTVARVREMLKNFRDDLLIKTVDSEKFLEKILAGANFKLLKTVDYRHTQAIICKRDKKNEPSYIVVAFRGTEAELSDWLTDAKAIPKEDKVAGTKVHSGFWDALNGKLEESDESVLEQVDAILKAEGVLNEKQKIPCFFTGHSLGGALALITTREIAKDIDGACYTYGAPRVANYNYFNNLKTPVFRVVNSSDIVPRVPPGAIMGLILKLVQGLGWLTRCVPVARKSVKWLETKIDQLNGYRHHGDQRYLTDVKSGNFKDVRLLSNPPVIDRIWWMWQHIRKSFLEPVKSHGMAIYRNKLAYLAVSRNRGVASNPVVDVAAEPGST